MLHIALVDATGNNAGTVSAEIPVGPTWCEIRQTVFGWTTQKFPFGVKTAHTLKFREPHIITVTGKSFYDIGHAPADHSNRRSTPKGYAVWSSGDEDGSDAMKDWEIIADDLSKAGWSWGCLSAVDRDGEQSGLLTHTATIASVSLYTPMRY
jgi:hypothetical protein